MSTTTKRTTDKTTWTAGMNDARPRAAALLAKEQYAEFYELLTEYKELMERTPCRFYSGQIDGCRDAMQRHASAIGAAAGTRGLA